MRLIVTPVICMTVVCLLLCAGCKSKEPGGAQAFWRAQQYQQQGQLASAKQELDEAIRQDPENVGYQTVRAHIYMMQKDYDNAILAYTQAIAVNNKQDRSMIIDVSCRVRRADAYIGKGDYATGVAEYRAVVDANPHVQNVCNRLAWTLASCPDAAVRNGDLAVKYALRAYGENPRPRPYVIDTLAAAYAEAGNYAEAVRRQQEAISKLSASDNRADYESRLRVYQSGQPYHESR